MSDDDMIRRGEALSLPPYDGDGDPAGMFDHHIFAKLSDLRAIPAVQVGVKPLEWDDFDGKRAKAQAWGSCSYLISNWDDGLFELEESYPGYGTSVDGIARFYPSIEAAKAAAQADYEARIRSALIVTPAPDAAKVAALVDALGDEYVLDHPLETSEERMGRHSVVRGIAVRMGCYPQLGAGIIAALAAIKEPKL